MVSQTESIMAKTALCIESYADALSKTDRELHISYGIYSSNVNFVSFYGNFQLQAQAVQMWRDW